MTLNSGFVKRSLFVLSANGWKDENLDSLFRKRDSSIGQSIVLQYDVKAKYRLISRKFSGMNFFSPER